MVRRTKEVWLRGVGRQREGEVEQERGAAGGGVAWAAAGCVWWVVDERFAGFGWACGACARSGCALMR